jgi:hypothetical protein
MLVFLVFMKILYACLIYGPMAGMTFIAGSLLLKDTHGDRIWG